MFKELSKEKNHIVESNISNYWDSIDILKKSIELRKDKENFVFFDGPATANGEPGVHHMMAKFLKDSFCKYKTMNGYKVERKIGWDTHGLPVEVQVEKELGFKSKNDIEAFGIKEFNDKCRESVWVNEKAFTTLTKNMGQFIDIENPYITYDNNYIETEWWILKKFFDEGYFYEGHKILPYCCRCGTGLASHEVAQGYKEINVETVIVPMKIVNEENTYFLVWTTTPWTLISNVAICVNPDEEYGKYRQEDKYYIVAKKLADKVLGDEKELVESYTGKELEYKEYHQLIESLNTNEKAFYVTNDSFVTMEDGTGIVHMAPAFGQDDYNVGRKYKLPVFNPVKEDGTYSEGLWQGMKVFDADIEIIKYLKENNKLYKKQRVIHNYPHCWRCDTPLLYYSKPSWYIEVTKLKDKIIENNKGVNWYPDFVGEKRFGNWLENLNDWAISRNRYWGVPLPLWICECSHKEMIGSRKELVEKSIEEIDETIELHRPYVDNIHINCSVCNKKMTRVKEVIDCWFDSGSMPFAQYHYPFENKELWEQQFPADFICEGIDQTRGWFYSLMVISTFVTGKSPYKNVLVNDLLLDKHGKKMSKSKGNKMDPFALIEKYGADAVRFYLPYVSPVWTPTRFDEEGLKEVYSKFFNTFKNTYSFFALYANTDKIEPTSLEVAREDYEEIDLWLLSKYNKLVDYITNSYEEYDLTKVVRSATEFVSEDLSNWYIRRNRRRFWDSELNNSKKAVYKITYEVLLGLSKLLAPIIPFTTEEIYRNLTNKESIHLEDFPKADLTYVNETLMEKMDLVRNLISLGRNVREETRIKVRQPISEVILDARTRPIINDLSDLIKEELNVKEITFVDELALYMNVSIKPNFKICGKLFGAAIKEFQDKLLMLTNEEYDYLDKSGSITMTIDSKDTVITKEMVEIRVSSKEGFNASHEGNNFIVLNTTLTKELIQEGIAREIISKVQQLRKSKDFNIVDRINILYDANEKVEEVLSNYEQMIKDDTLTITFVKTELQTEEIIVNNETLKLDVEKIIN